MRSHNQKMLGQTKRPLRLATVAVLSLAMLQGGPLAAITGVSLLHAQARGPAQRTVVGKVEDKSGAALKGAVVYLRDNHSQSVRSAISNENGGYRFVQLSQSTDYDLWAQIETTKSKTRSISSFDGKNDFNITLTIDK